MLEIDNVSKIFAGKKAVNGISFTVEPGRIFGLLGPNGAGKTTTIRMIANIYIPDGGKITIDGETVNSGHQEMIGYLPEERGLYKKIKVIDQLAYFGQLKGMAKPDALNAANHWLAKMDAIGWADKKIQELSKGMQQKIQFISTILHDPEILILDEPFSGFDPVNVELLKSIILDFKASGKTIILSTHVMQQVEQMCDDICLINKGSAVLQGNVREVKRGFGRDTAIIEFDGSDSFLNNLGGIQFINKTKSRAEFRIKPDISSKMILEAAMKSAEIIKYELVEPSLNEIFIDVISNEEKANEAS